MPTLIHQVVRYRELLFALSKRELTARYRGSLFGRLWLVLQPLLHLAVYYIVFVAIRGPAADLGDGHAFLLLAGVVPWLSFAEVSGRSANFVFQNGNLIRKYAFPVEILPLQMVGVALFNLCVGLLLLMGLFFFLGPDWPLPQHLWMLVPLLAFHALFLVGFLYLISSLAVYVRDITQVMPMLTLAWFFMSPIFLFEKYTRFTHPLAGLVQSLNPATYFIGAIRQIFVWRKETIPEDPPRALAGQEGAAESVAGADLDAPPSQVTGESIPDIGLDGQFSQEIVASWALSKEVERNGETVHVPMSGLGEAPWQEVLIYGAISFVVFFIGYRVFVALKPGFADEI